MPTLHTGIDCKCPRAILEQTGSGDHVVAIVTCHGPAHAPRPPRTTVVLIEAEDARAAEAGKDLLDGSLRVLLDEGLREGLAFGRAVSMTLDARCVEDLADAVVGVALKIVVAAAFTVADMAAVVPVVARLHDNVEIARDPGNREAVEREVLQALRDRGIRPEQIRRIAVAGEDIRVGGAASPAQDRLEGGRARDGGRPAPRTIGGLGPLG
ncbi:hypothetical protein ACFVH6_43800 [Spirillospora sp. NPDC127200]